MKKILFLLIIFSSIVIAGNSILVYTFKASGVEPSTIEAIQDLFISELTGIGYEAISPAVENDNCFESKCAAQGALENKTDEALYGTINKLGDKLILSIFLVNSSGELIHSDKMNSQNVEDLDVVIERLVQGIYQGKSSKEVIDKTSIASSETEEPRRRKNFYTIGAKIGYRFPLGNSYGKEQMWQYEGLGIYEMEKMFVEGRFYGCSGGDAFAFGLTIGAYYIFSPKDFSPYVGGSAGIEWVNEMPYYSEDADSIMGGASGDGPAINIGGGLMLFQTYDFRVILDLKYTMVFVGEADIDWYESNPDNAKDLGVQNSIGITLGITRRDIGGNRNSGMCCMPW